MTTRSFFAKLKRSVNFTTQLLLSRSFCSGIHASRRTNLASRIIPLGKPSISLLPVLDLWFQEGKAVNSDELRSIVKDLRDHKRYAQALQLESVYVMQWNIELTRKLNSVVFTQSANDQCLFTKTSDDILMTSGYIKIIDWVKGFLDATFTIKNLGAKPIGTPMVKTDRVLGCNRVKLKNPEQHRRLIGRLLHLGFTRPDITYATHQLCHFVQEPTEDHWQADLYMVSEWMRSKGLCPFSPGDQAVQLDLIGRVRGLNFAESYFQDLSDKDKSEKQYGALLKCYVREGLLDKSLSLMHKMKELGYASALDYNNIMCLYMRTDQHEKVPKVFAQMKEDGVSPNRFSYWICLSSYGARSDLASMEKLLEEMERRSYNNKDWNWNWNTYSLVANIYIKAGEKEKALINLKNCEHKAGSDALAYNHLISQYACLGNKNAVMRVWKLQKDMCKSPVNRDYKNILRSLLKLGDFEETKRLVEEWESSGNIYDFRVPNILLVAYSRKGMIEKAETMLRSMVDKGKTPTPNSWAIIAYGCVAKQEMEKAFQCMNEAVAVRAQSESWRPNKDIISSILSWISDNKDMDEVEEFVNSLKTVTSMTRDIYLSLIKVYVRCGKEVDGILESMKADDIVLDEDVKNILASKEL
ncbi:pentatricopeptide repeat-containing protein [Senna tora]|uniref:Pentatricopeptide repeat-containing protein n=1 Tax=Senna tora TaxID=362788 RepID=A0A834WHB7_9FABA|nr:pentatricopeptide repeat-containing protein [Senna tora]